MDRRMVKRGNTVIVQVQVLWSSLPLGALTWQDYDVLQQQPSGKRFHPKQMSLLHYRLIP